MRKLEKIGEHITLTNPMMELTWFPVTDEIKQLLKQAADAWGDSAEADRLMEAAIAQSNHDLTVLTAAYRFFFYKNNNRAALRVAEAVIGQVRASGNLPEDWETLKGILRDRKEEPEIRLFLNAYTASGLLRARLGDLDAAKEISIRVQEIDDCREFGATTVMDILTNLGDEDDD